MKIPPHVALAVRQALTMLPREMSSVQALTMMYAIGLQESRFTARAQIVQGRPGAKGPARGYWQFERGGGCKGVVEHAASRYWMAQACTTRGVPFTAADLWARIETDDVLAAVAARLLLFTDPKRLPSLGDPEAAWALYIRVWRPGQPHKASWAEAYETALMEVTR